MTLDEYIRKRHRRGGDHATTDLLIEFMAAENIDDFTTEELRTVRRVMDGIACNSPDERMAEAANGTMLEIDDLLAEREDEDAT